MALLKRYGLYTVIAACILYFLYSLSFPYEQPQSGNHREHGQPQKPRKTYDWTKVPIKHPVESMIALPTAQPKALPKVQFDFKAEDATAKNIRLQRQGEVKKSFEKAWQSYRSRAWLRDELEPISGGGKDTFGGWAATLIDAMDTLWIMDLKEEFESAIKDIESINFGTTPLDKVNVFETNIRHLGGLLAAYELSGDKRLLNKAKEVGEMLYHAFDTPNHMPITRWNLHAAGEGKAQVADETVLLAEIGSMCMEFTKLSKLTNEPKWYDAITRITQVLEKQQDSTKIPGLWPIVVNAKKPDFTYDTGFSIAAMADSTYEYFAKMYALLGGVDPTYKKLYEKSMDAAIKHTLYRPMIPDNADLLMVGSARVHDTQKTLSPEMQHLACYAGGMFALGGKLFENEEHLKIGRKITDACVWAYKASPAGIMPEVSHHYQCPNNTACEWNEEIWQQEVKARASSTGKEEAPEQNIANLRLPKGFTAVDDRRYILRPEAIESVFVMYRITGEQSWQAAAWDMFTAIEKATSTELANAALIDVSTEHPPKMNSMESFWMAETLKYFYLIFSEPNHISLDDYVFNTEAHPFKIPKPK